MNLRNVLCAYSLLRQMSDEELAQLEIWRGATDAERALIVETLSDKPQKKSSKKAAGGGGRSLPEHCDVCDMTRRAVIHNEPTAKDYHQFVTPKSARASGMAAQLNKQLDGRREPEIPDFGDSGLCGKCGRSVDDNSHHRQTDPNYHDFVPPASSAAGAGD